MNPQQKIDIHIKTLLITIAVLAFMFMLWWLAEYHPRPTLIVILTIMSVGLPALIYWLVYNALKNNI